jgi:hypothetical protein
MSASLHRDRHREFDHSLSASMCLPVIGPRLVIWESRIHKMPSIEEPIMESDTDVATNRAVERVVIDRVRAGTRGQIRGLEVDCDGDVVTIRGEVDSWHVWWLAFDAAWIEARNAGGLLFDLQVAVLPPIENKRGSLT